MPLPATTTSRNGTTQRLLVRAVSTIARTAASTTTTPGEPRWVTASRPPVENEDAWRSAQLATDASSRTSSVSPRTRYASTPSSTPPPTMTTSAAVRARPVVTSAAGPTAGGGDGVARRDRRRLSVATAQPSAVATMTRTSSGMGMAQAGSRSIRGRCTQPIGEEADASARALDVERSPRTARRPLGGAGAGRPPRRARGAPGRPAARTASGGGVLRGAARRLRRARADLDRARAARDRRAARHGRSRADRRERRPVDRRRAHAVPHGRLRGRLDAGRRPAAADPGGSRSRWSARSCASG